MKSVPYEESQTSGVDDYDLALAGRCASILGSGCTAAQAMAERERRIAADEDPVIIYARGNWMVVPRSTTREMMGS